MDLPIHKLSIVNDIVNAVVMPTTSSLTFFYCFPKPIFTLLSSAVYFQLTAISGLLHLRFLVHFYSASTSVYRHSANAAAVSKLFMLHTWVADAWLGGGRKLKVTAVLWVCNEEVCWFVRSLEEARGNVILIFF